MRTPKTQKTPLEKLIWRALAIVALVLLVIMLRVAVADYLAVRRHLESERANSRPAASPRISN